MLLILLTFIFSLPPVQKTVARKTVEQINRKYRINIQVGKLNLFPPGKIEAESVFIADHHGDTLFYARRMQTGIRNIWDALRGKIRLKPLHLHDATAKIITYSGEKKDNWSIFFDKFSEDGKQGNSSHSVLHISAVVWNKGKVVIADYNHAPHPAYELRNLSVYAENFEIKGSRMHASIRKTSFDDSFGLRVRQVQGDYFYTPDSMGLRNLVYRTAYSQLRGYLLFRYDREKLRHFTDEADLEGFLKGKIGTDDANLFADGIFVPGKVFDWQSGLSGVLNELELDSVSWKFPGTRLRYAGDLVLYDITRKDSSGFHADGRLQIQYEDLQILMPEISERRLPKNLQALGLTLLKGEFDYRPQYISARMHARAKPGSALTAFTYRFDSVPFYRFRLHTPGMDAGKILDMPSLGIFEGRLTATGTNLHISRTRSQLYVNAKRFGYKGYVYRNLLLKGNVVKGIFSGKLDVNDPSLKGTWKGDLALDGRRQLWKFRTDVKHWDLYKTGWLRQDTLAQIRFAASADMRGNSVDNLMGRLQIRNLLYRRTGQEYKLKFLNLISSAKGTEKEIRIESDKAVNGFMRGNFAVSRLPLMFRQVLGTVFPGFKPRKSTTNESVRFRFKFDTNLLQILDPSVKFTRNTLIKGRISTKDNYIHTDVESEELIYDGLTFFNARLSIDNRNPIYNMYIKADSVASDFYSLENLRAINVTIRDTVYLKLKGFGGPGRRDTLDIGARYTLDTLGNLRLRFMPSRLKIKNKEWRMDPEKHFDMIAYYPASDSLAVRDLVLFHENESLRVDGFNTPERRKITADARRLHMEDWLPPMENFQFAGIVSVRLISGKNKQQDFYNVSGQVENLKWNDVLLGKMEGTVRTISSETFFLDTKIHRDGTDLLRANGYVDRKSRDLNVHVNLDEFPLTPFNEVLKDIFRNVRGEVSGHTAVTGKLKNPLYHGELYLKNAGLTVNELNVDYRFADRQKIRVDGQKFVFNRNEFEDTRYHTTGTLDGYVSFYNFTNWYLDLDIAGDNLLVLDTPYSEEALYYGTAFVNGHGKISGYTHKIKIDARVASRPRTRIYIPLKDVETVGEDPYIRFYDEEEYEKKKQNPDQKIIYKVYEGLELNLDIDITQDAEIEIVLDQEFGSRLKSRGEGNVLMEIDTEGKFNMWGTYTVAEGKYNFRYAGVIDKEFDVEPGSTIIWNGDPFRAELDIKAVYFIPAADITPLLSESVPYAKRVPVKVIIYIKGDLMKPRIDFDVELPEASPVIRSEVEYALRDPDMRMLQVISLLYSGNFISPNVLKFDNMTAVEGNLSERVLSVFNSLLENDIFNVKLDYVPDRQDPHTNVKTDSRVGLTIQTKINKRIYINGKLAMPVGRYTKSSVSGDIEADIWLTEDGTIQLRIYNKRTEIEFVDQEESYTRGLGISFQVDFDTFKEILSKLKIRIETEER